MPTPLSESAGSISSSLRGLFAAVFLVSLVVGGWLYGLPEVATDFWPYPSGPLATRFFASVFLAVAVASFMALREKRRSDVQVLLVAGLSVFGLILLSALVNLPNLETSKPGALVWLAILAVLTAGSFYFLLLGKGHQVTYKPTPMPLGLRYSLLAHTLVVLVFSLQMLITPDVAREFWPWSVTTIIMQGFGGLFLGVAVATGWSFRQASFERVRILLPVNVTFVTLVLVAVVIHWGVIDSQSPGIVVSLAWLVLYLYTGGYALLYLLLGSPGRKRATAG